MAPVILALAQLAPSIIGLLTRDKTAAKAAEVVSQTARALTGESSDDAALRVLKDDPAKMMEYQQAMNAHAASMYAEETRRLESINETIRAEVASADPYVRRMRPTFGYCVAFSWVMMMTAIVITIIRTPQHAATVITAFASMGFIWTVALAVLGVYVYKRSDEKGAPKGIGTLGGLAGLLKRGG